MSRRLSILALVLSSLLLFSCSSRPKSLFIVSDSGSELYFSNNGVNSEVVIPKSVQDYLLDLSGMSLNELYAFMAEGTENETFFTLGSDFLLRSNYVALLVSQYGKDSLMETYSEYRRSIQNSEIFKRIDGISQGFDSILMKLSKGREFSIYSLYYIFNGKESWGDLMVFLPEWLRRIRT